MNINLKYSKTDKNIPPINENIQVPKVQLITHEGENLGVVPTHEALLRARSAELDLVLISQVGGTGIPIAKIMDFGKDLYSKKKKQAEAKKKQKTIQVKELKIRPKIGEHDLQTKMNQAIQFLKEGKHLKVTLVFRGREVVSREERGSEMFAKIDKKLEEQGFTNLAQEKESRMGSLWSRIYYLKTK